MKNLTVLGILGGIGCGKSTVAGLFGELGACVLDADRMAHDCLQREAIREAIRIEFGPDVFDDRGGVDRGRLAALVFPDEERLLRLNGIVHPCVRREIMRCIEQLRESPRREVAVLDVPLLLESELNALCDRRVFVDAPANVRRERVIAHRGWNAEELELREKKQKSIEYKEAVADYKIDNGGAIEPVRTRVRAIFQDLIR